MKYFVVLPDGKKFGPVDVSVLNQWIKENRLTQESMLEEELSGEVQKAAALPGLDFTGDKQPIKVVQERTDQILNPFDPLAGVESSSRSAVQTAQMSPVQDTRYANPPGPATNYPRVGYGFNSGALPEEIRRRFNWGAFFFSWIWGVNHKAYWMLWGLLVGLIPCGGLIFSIVCGQKGNEAAWNSGRFATIEEMLDCQRIWGYWALTVFVMTAVTYGLLIAGGFFAQ